mmetsp:Transcript_37552/g.48574  ORF Transcript_37552/g.48574 Transcript_37552/m.48574 type:complete len:149 (-) Transcript_37552:196-642(-)
MKSETKILLQKFFTPWNDALRLLLIEKNVQTVPGYPVEVDPSVKPSSSSSSFSSNVYMNKHTHVRNKINNTVSKVENGLWWWNYDSIDQTSKQEMSPSTTWLNDNKNLELNLSQEKEGQGKENNHLSSRRHRNLTKPKRTISASRGSY